MKKQLILSLLGIILAAAAYGQKRSYIQTQPSSIDSLVEARHQRIKGKKTHAGFRVQVFSGTERKAAMELRSKLMLDYPDDQVILDFHPPYFKIKIGAYTTRLEAYRKLLSLMTIYPEAFIVSDQIPIQE